MKDDAGKYDSYSDGGLPNGPYQEPVKGVDVQAAPLPERSAQDFAIEHAGYMADYAEQLIDAVNDLAMAEQERDEGTANPSDVHAAQDTLRECLGTMRNRIYEFRKRRARALAALSQGWVSVDERLPPMNTEVLIAFRDDTLPATGQYTASPNDTWGWCFPSENDPEETGPITHWRALPEHPGAVRPKSLLRKPLKAGERLVCYCPPGVCQAPKGFSGPCNRAAPKAADGSGGETA